jgi:NitT/TauT family transport system ATP-binding protein
MQAHQADQSPTPPHLAVEAVTKSFRSRRGSFLALDGVHMHVELNELVCIVGASGSGKSTLLRIIAGLLSPTSGSVRVDGIEMIGPGPDRGMVFQHDTLYPWLTVAANVRYGLKRRGASRAEQRERVEHYLEVVGLERFADTLPHQLSGGMKQRVAIARALANEPALLLMDEPFGALDAQTRLIMQEFLLRVWRETHTSMLLVTHDVSEAVFLAQRIYLLSSNPGRVRTELEVPLPEERDYTTKRTPIFQDMEIRLETLLREESLKQEPVA